MNKKQREELLSLDVISCDISNLSNIDKLIRSFKGDFRTAYPESGYSEWKNKVINEIEHLISFQKLLKQYVDYSITQNKESNSTDKNFYDLKNIIEENACKFRNPDFPSTYDIVEEIIIPGLCLDITANVYRKGDWDRIITCSECNKYFKAKTKRDQFYCSKGCKEKHRNRERKKSGQFAKYMSEYRRKRKQHSM